MSLSSKDGTIGSRRRSALDSLPRLLAYSKWDLLMLETKARAEHLDYRYA